MRILDYLSIIRGGNIDSIYISSFFRSLSKSVFKIFVPVLLMSYGYSVEDIMIKYYLVFYFVWISTSLPTILFVKRYGAKLCFIVGIFFSLIDILLLFNKVDSLVFLAITSGFGDGFFWTAYHSYFVKSTQYNQKESTRGRILSTIKIISRIGGIVGPIIGSFLLSNENFVGMVLLTSFLYFSALFPLLLSSKPIDYNENDSLNDEILSISKEEGYDNYFISITKDFMCLASYGVEKSMGSVLWQFYSAVNYFDKKYSSIQKYNSIITIFSLILIFLMGKIIDSKRKYSLILGSFLNALIWFFRVFTKDIVTVTWTGIIYGWTGTLMGISFFASTYDRADTPKMLDNILFQEVAIGTGYMISFILFHLISPSLESPSVFIFASLVSLIQPLFLFKIKKDE